MEQTKLSPGIKVAAAVVVLVGILAQCGGFFLHMLIGQPGAFYPFVDSPVSRFTDKTTSLSEVFGAGGNALEKAILAAGEDEERIELAEAFLRSRRPERDERVELINEIIEHVAADQLDRREFVDWPTLAADLGYFDQAHFIKDFKKTIGVPPGEYVRWASRSE